MRRLTLPCITLALGLTACGDGASTDLDGGARPDAFVPPTDSGATDDAAPADGGSDAGMLPSALTEARDTVQASLVLVDDAFDAVPPATSSVGADFLQASLTRVRLDAVVGEKGLLDGVVGEKGLGTRSLSLETAPVMVILRQVQLATDAIARLESNWLTATDPAVIALRDALTALRTDLETLRAELLVHFRELATLTAGLGRADTEHTDRRPFHLTPDGVTMQAVIEAPAGETATTLRVDCTTALMDLAITVTDVESNAQLLLVGNNGGLVDHTFTARAGEATLVHVSVRPVAGITRWQACNLSLLGHRYWRDDEITVDDTALAGLGTQWDTAMRTLDTDLEAARSSGGADFAVANEVQRFGGELSIETGFWRSGFALVEADELEMMKLTLRDVLPAMLVALEASPQLAGTTWNAARDSLMTLHDTHESAMAVLTR